MSLTVVDQGEAIILKALVGHTAGQALTIRLFTNNITPGETDTESTYVEASGSGYLAKALTGGSWVVSGTNPTQIAYAAQTWTFSGALGNVYGYYLTQTTSGLLVWAERFTNAPFGVANNGDTITVTPLITCA